MESLKNAGISIGVPNMGKYAKAFDYMAVLAGIMYLGHINFLMFHAVTELFGIVIAFNMTIISVSTYEANKNNRIVFLGIAYGFVACFNFLHALAFKGMGIFPQDSANLSTQMGVIARYMESISLLIAFNTGLTRPKSPAFIGGRCQRAANPLLNEVSFKFPDMRLNIKRIISIYSGITAILLLSVFWWNIFPKCYLKNSGLTPFKIVSECIIIIVLLSAIYCLEKNNHSISKRMNIFLLLSLTAAVFSEIFFIYYIRINDPSVFIGHVFKLISFYFIYKALAEFGLKQPYLVQRELNRLLNEKNRKLEKAIERLKVESKKREEIEELQKEMEIKQALLEKSKEMEELKNHFFCTVSHELKTPVNAILGSIQLISNMNKGSSIYWRYDQSEKYMKVMQQNCNRLIKLVNNLVDITKIDSGYLQLNLKNSDIVAIIEDITLSAARHIESKGISLTFDTDIEEKIIACDAYRLERVMLNLLSNAIKFTAPGGSIWVNVRDKGEKIEISVRDTGVGIPENMLEAVFHRFRQVDSSFTRKSEGSGIGLCIVKSIIELHGGKISLNSEVGKGSEFIIELPAYLAEDEGECKETAAARQSNMERVSIEFSDIYDI